MKKVFFIIATGCFMVASAQNQTTQNIQNTQSLSITKDPNDTIPKTWKTGGLFSLNLAQGSLSNWAAGGDDYSLTLATYINAHAFYLKGKTSWDNNLDINLAYINTTSLGARKNDDRVELLSKYGYTIGKKWDVAALFDFRSQFFKGYTYSSSTQKTLSSAALAPAYILFGPGFNYRPAKGLSVYLSPATVRLIVVTNDSLASIGAYGVDDGKHLKTQVGAYLSIQYLSSLTKTISYTGRMELFSDYFDQPQNVAMYMTNLFAAKLSKILAVTYSLDLIYDDKVKLFGPDSDAPRLQLKSLIGVGLLVKL